MKVLIIGGTGVLSTAVVNEALKQGLEVTMINRGNRCDLIPKTAELIKSDKKDTKKIYTYLKNRQFDAVMDFLCYSDEETTDSFNFYSQFTKQYFFISSCAIYNTSSGGIFQEDSPKVLPIWSYSVNKWASEEHLMKLAQQSNINYTVIRPCVTYGDTRIPYGISPMYGYHWTLVARIMHNKPIIRWNKGVNRCNMMRVEDFAIGVVGLIGNPKAYNEAFNICGDETPSFNEVLGVLSELTGKEVKTIDVSSEFYAKEIPERAGEILGGRSIDALNSNDKIKSVVPSFCQTITLREGIAMTYNAYKNNHYQDGIDWSFDGECDRVVRDWCIKQGLEVTSYNLCFFDYLGNATIQDRLKYYFVFHKNRMDIRLLSLIRKVLVKLKRALKSLK